MNKTEFSRRAALTLGVSLLCGCVLLGGCKRRDKKIRVQQTDEDSMTMASVVQMGDPKVQSQLLKGFYNIESNTWRWTMGKFSVALRPPRNAAAKGATLHLKFVLPEAVLSKIKTTSISASIGGSVLSPETYTQPGEFDYARDVDGKLLAGEAVNVEFSMDKFLTSGMVEDRELGVIATSVGFEAK
jgi:hypothetical protein